MTPPDKTKDIGDQPDGQFTPRERQELRRILEADRSLRWVWAAARNFAMWVTAIAAGVAAYLQYFRHGGGAP